MFGKYDHTEEQWWYVVAFFMIIPIVIVHWNFFWGISKDLITKNHIIVNKSPFKYKEITIEKDKERVIVKMDDGGVRGVDRGSYCLVSDKEVVYYNGGDVIIKKPSNIVWAIIKVLLYGLILFYIALPLWAFFCVVISPFWIIMWVVNLMFF